jgi:hypothetical protein
VKRILLALVIACGKKEAPVDDQKVPPMSGEEMQRSRDACQSYLDQVCACATKVPAVKQQCDLARALPDAVRLGLEVAASPDSKKNDVLAAQGQIRKTVKECIEQTAKLPALGCQ